MVIGRWLQRPRAVPAALSSLLVTSWLTLGGCGSDKPARHEAADAPDAGGIEIQADAATEVGEPAPVDDGADAPEDAAVTIDAIDAVDDPGDDDLPDGRAPDP